MPMIEPLTGVPEGVIAFEAVGKVHSSDYQQVLGPAVDRAAKSGAVRLVYVLGDRFEGYSAGAGLADFKLGVSHFSAWKRLAVVTDSKAISDGVAALGWLVPGELRHFPLAERDAAIDWAAGG